MNTKSIYSRTREQLYGDLAQAIASFRSRKQEETPAENDVIGDNHGDQRGTQPQAELPE